MSGIAGRRRCSFAGRWRRRALRAFSLRPTLAAGPRGGTTLGRVTLRATTSAGTAFGRRALGTTAGAGTTFRRRTLRTTTLGWRALRSHLAGTHGARRRRQHFVHGQLAIVVLVERAQGGAGAVDFFFRERAVLVGVERRDDGRNERATRAAVRSRAGGRRRRGGRLSGGGLLGMGEARCDHESGDAQCEQVFHDGFWMVRVQGRGALSSMAGATTDARIHGLAV